MAFTDQVGATLQEGDTVVVQIDALVPCKIVKIDQGLGIVASSADPRKVQGAPPMLVLQPVIMIPVIVPPNGQVNGVFKLEQEQKRNA